MRRIRVIPVLTIIGNKLVKTLKFKKPKYIGDPINAIKIFNDKEVDEILILDITASVNKQKPNYKLIEEMAGECFMPMGYGGGINDFETAKEIFKCGAEKIVVNTAINTNIKLISQIKEHYGSQSVVGCIDIKSGLFGRKHPYYKSGKIKEKNSLLQLAQTLESVGVGELIINSIDRDGTFKGYDVPVIASVADHVSIPIVACGGASSLEDYTNVVKAGASAVAGSSMFVFKGMDRDSILINYPTQNVLIDKVYSQI